jgi:hypothetical protein
MDNNNIFNRFDDPKSKFNAVIGFIASGITTLLIFSLCNKGEGNGYFDYSRYQVLVVVIMSFIGSGQLYKYKNKVLHAIFSEISFLFVLSLIVLTYGLRTYYNESIYLKHILYTGSDARLWGIFQIILAFALMCVCILKIAKANNFLQRTRSSRR